MSDFIPLPAEAVLPHSYGWLIVTRGDDGKPTYQRRLYVSKRVQDITHAEAVEYATHQGSGIAPRLRALLFPPPLTIHHLAREHFEAAMVWAEDGAFLTAAARIEDIARDYRARHAEVTAEMAQHVRRTA